MYPKFAWVWNVLVFVERLSLWVFVYTYRAGEGVHITVYTGQRLPITLIKFHTAQGDSLCPDQIANISWLKYMFAKRLERKQKSTQTDDWKYKEKATSEKKSETVCDCYCTLQLTDLFSIYKKIISTHKLPTFSLLPHWFCATQLVLGLRYYVEANNS